MKTEDILIVKGLLAIALASLLFAGLCAFKVQCQAMTAFIGVTTFVAGLLMPSPVGKKPQPAE